MKGYIKGIEDYDDRIELAVDVPMPKLELSRVGIKSGIEYMAKQEEWENSDEYKAAVEQRKNIIRSIRIGEIEFKYVE